jgi:ParB family chromosome partitioning protein
MHTEYQEIPLELVIADKNQPRKKFDSDSMQELINSVRKNGVIQPIIVQKKDKKYQIVAGERRFRASKAAGLRFIPAIIKNLEKNRLKEFSLIENLQREELNITEEALAYQELIEKFCYTHQNIADAVSKSRSHITNCLRILTLPNNALKLLECKKISLGHAKLLVGLKNADQIAQIIVTKSLNVRQTEKMIQGLNSKTESKKQKSDDLKALESRISENLGMDVTITDNNDKYGLIKIVFKNLKQLEEVLKRLS